MKKIIFVIMLGVFLISAGSISSAAFYKVADLSQNNNSQNNNNSNGDNNPPSGVTINGPDSGKVDNSYTFSASASDPDGDMLYYTFSWGDGASSGPHGPYVSGMSARASHSWGAEGTYAVSVTVSDGNGGSCGPATTSIKIKEEESEPSYLPSSTVATPFNNNEYNVIPNANTGNSAYDMPVIDMPDSYDDESSSYSSSSDSSSSGSSSDDSDSSADGGSEEESSSNSVEMVTNTR